jgi:hypothetical protein
MADETTTGAKTDVTVDNSAVTAKETQRKKMIKYVVIALVLVGAFFLAKKYIFKK